MTVSDPIRAPVTLAEHAIAYARDGWPVFPVEPCGPHAKAPIGSLVPHGAKQATCDLETVANWWRARPDALIGHRLPPGTVLLDVDPRHGGNLTWQALRDTYGTILTRVHYSGRGDNGGHVWTAKDIPPDHRLNVTRLDNWAKEHGTGMQLASKWTCGIDFLHHGHRYTILPPSPHPDTGRPYDWRGKKDSPVAPMPDWLASLVLVPLTPPALPSVQRDTDSIAQWFTDTTTWPEILGPHGWVEVGRDRWRHPQATNAHSATITHDCLFVYTSSTVFEETTDGSPCGYTRFKAWAVLNHRGDLSAAARAARELKDGPRTAIDVSWAEAKVPEPASAASLNLPDTFWQARPVLEHIRQAAHHRSASPDAVLLAVLARYAAYSNHQYEIPPVVGTPGSLNFYGAIVAPSGTGKTIATAISGELVPPPMFIDVADELPLGSGEGIAEAYMGEKEEDREDGKGKKKVRAQVRWNAFITIDEGAALIAMMDRAGATVLESLRRGWSGSTLGQANASAERWRIIRAGDYRLGLIVAFQPELAGRLLADAIAGTPQRFLFAHAQDPDLPDLEPDWPGEIPFPEIPPSEIDTREHKSRGGMTRRRLTVAKEITTEVRARHKAKARGQITVNELDSQEPMHRLKVAGLLAMMDGRLDITTDDWLLADTLWATSCAVRSDVVATVAAEHIRTEDTRLEAHVRREIAGEAARRAVPARVEAIAKHVAKWAHEQDAPEGHTRSMIANGRINSRERDLTDAVLAHAVERGYLQINEFGRYVPGEARPL